VGSVVETSTQYFSSSGLDRHGFDKNRIGTRYAELAFVLPVGSAGHLVHSGASRA
jgi:hypothetical protein